MTVWIILSGIIAPAVFWSGYLYYKDRFQPEPIRNLGITYILGLIAAYACMKFYGLLPLVGIPDDPSALMETQSLEYFLYSLGVIGLVEELFKFLPFLFIILRLKAFDETIDGIVYASTIALGFASFENIYYLKYLEGFELFGRAFASPLTHTIFSSIWGYTVGKARIHGKSLFKASLIGLSIAALVHGVFDFLTISSTLRIAASLIVLIIWIWRIRVMERSSREKK
ncbi:MAG: PrsW family intramembrane metalloprotease [Candidatus Aminicenantes bacterium]|nr:PrsW family intramembrane metalloprotease [Candidatus Aminicenantes bacterium]